MYIMIYLDQQMSLDFWHIPQIMLTCGGGFFPHLYFCLLDLLSLRGNIPYDYVLARSLAAFLLHAHV